VAGLTTAAGLGGLDSRHYERRGGHRHADGDVGGGNALQGAGGAAEEARRR